MLGLGLSALLGLAVVGLTAGGAYCFARVVRKSRSLARPPRWPMVVGAGLGIVITILIYPYVVPRYREAYVAINADTLMKQFEGDLTLYSAMRKYEPVLYQEVRTAVLDGLKRDLPKDEMIATARAPITRAIPRMITQAPDAPVIEMWQVIIDEARVFNTSRPELCISIMTERPLGDITSILPKELTQRDLAALERLISAPKQPDRPKMGALERKPLLAAIIADASKSKGIPRSDFREMVSGKIPPERACAAFVAFAQGIIDLPPGQAGPVLRGFADSKNN